MSEIGTVALVCAAGIPLSLLVQGLVFAGVQRQYARLLASTYMVGGQPLEVYKEKQAFDLEQKKRAAVRSVRPVKAHEVIS